MPANSNRDNCFYKSIDTPVPGLLLIWAAPCFQFFNSFFLNFFKEPWGNSQYGCQKTVQCQSQKFQGFFCHYIPLILSWFILPPICLKPALPLVVWYSFLLSSHTLIHGWLFGQEHAHCSCPRLWKALIQKVFIIKRH